MKQLFNIEGHVAFVTGAASGLGLAYAEVMAENGAKVVLADINAEGLEAVHARLKAAGCDVEPLTVDIGDDEALRNAIEGTAARHGRLDIVFANAGGSAGPGFSLTPDGSIDVADLAARFGTRLGADLSAVRVHTGSAASDLSDAAEAKAFTVGSSIT